MPPLPVPPLARTGLDRVAARRSSLRPVPDPGAKVLVVRGDRAPVDRADQPGTQPVLRWLAAEDLPGRGLVGSFAFLGDGVDGAERWVLALHEDDEGTAEADAVWAPLRGIGSALGDEDAAAFVAAVSLGRWLVDAAYCPRCGSATEVISAGWARRCPQCRRDIFPRTDPAVIVAITDESSDRLLLGSHAARGMGRFSCFAGFVEAGESLEATVAREIAEEAGVAVRDIRYVASQAWPYPRSLMLGFSAITDTVEALADGEEIVEVRWFDRAQIGAALRGESEITLPGASSIARSLIERWHKARL